MDRKRFLQLTACSAGAFLSGNSLTAFNNGLSGAKRNKPAARELIADLVIAGGGLGGCAAAMAALRNGLSVIMTEETDWIGGQVSQQGVPPDEHQWIETHGCTQLYRDFRNRIRSYYVRNYPLTEKARANVFLNPGDGSVSRLCHEPKVAFAVLNEMLAPWLSSGRLTLLTDYRITGAVTDGDRIMALKASAMADDRILFLEAPFYIDATETGDLLPLSGTEYVTGSEPHKETGELHAPEKGDPGNSQAFTFCFAMDHIGGEEHTIEKPAMYDFWRNYRPQLKPPWPGKLLDLTYSNPSTLKPRELGFSPEGLNDNTLFNLWNYRRIINKDNFMPGAFSSDITIVNWPQNDFITGNLIDSEPAEVSKHLREARQLSLSLLYWLQTEAPRPDGGCGWPGLRLRRDIMGTGDGLAKYPYIRESRRIRALFTVLEEHVGRENRSIVTGQSEVQSADFSDSVGTGYYHIDLHPSAGGDNYIDFDSLPFQIPLGALIPVRMQNLIAGNKNIGTTHITNGCYRLHPVEWNIGESAGMLACFALKRKSALREVRENKVILEEFQNLIRSQGIETRWPGK